MDLGLVFRRTTASCIRHQAKRAVREERFHSQGAQNVANNSPVARIVKMAVRKENIKQCAAKNRA